MSISDQDLENLEELLDGELAEEQAQSLRRRMSSEPELAVMMDRLRADRQVRGNLFISLEPSVREVEPLLAELRRSVRKEELWGQRLRSIRNLTSVAAAIGFVFMTGWIARDRLRVGTPQIQQGNPAQIVAMQQQPNLRPQQQGNTQLVSTVPGEEPIRFVTPGGGLNLAGNGTPQLVNDGKHVYQVQFVDPSGRLIAVRQIDVQGNPQQFMDQLPQFRPNMAAPARPSRTDPVQVNHVEPAGQQ